MRPGVQLISRNTIKADLCKMYANEKQKLKAMLNRCNGRISLTSDMWSSLTTNVYICVIAHYVNTNWILPKRCWTFHSWPHHIMKFVCVKICILWYKSGWSRSSFSLSHWIMLHPMIILLCYWKINWTWKIVLVSSGEFFCLCCCAHILNLIV